MSKWHFKLTRSDNGYIVETNDGGVFVFEDSAYEVSNEANQLVSLTRAFKFIAEEEIELTKELCESMCIRVEHPLNQYEFEVNVDINEPEGDSMVEDDIVFGDFDQVDHIIPCSNCGGEPEFIYDKYVKPLVKCKTCKTGFVTDDEESSVITWNARNSKIDGTPLEDDCQYCYTEGGNGLAIGACRRYNLVDMNCENDCPDLTKLYKEEYGDSNG